MWWGQWLIWAFVWTSPPKPALSKCGSHATLSKLAAAAGTELPRNEGGSDSLLRNLDCAVIQQLHEIRQQNDQPPIDTVRGIFTEGEPAYPGAGFREKTHTQICVCNTLQIKGIFRVSQNDLV